MDYKEKVIALLKSQELSKEQKEKLEFIFPELKESEDERIRKEMLMFFKNFSENGTWKAIRDVDKWIDWLENQGKITKEWSEMKMNNIQTDLQEMVELKQKTEQGEQKPAFEMKTPEESLGVDSDTYNEIVDECIYGELKPTYTKEYNFHGIKFVPNFKKGDLIREKLSGRILTIKDFSYDTGLYTYDTGQFPITIQNQYELVEQKPAWSKEDEKIIRRIDSLLYSQCKIHGSEYEEIHNWLKSLRPQNTWKPSESDILLLERIANGESNPQDFQASLGGLIGQLKKLKG